MAAVTDATSSSTNQTVSTSTTKTKPFEDTKSEDFDTVLQDLLGTDTTKEVSEEELFAALLVERITAVKGSEAGAAFKSALQTAETEMTSANGYVPYEEAARKALQEYQEAGSLTSEEADYIHAEAFEAAQLDDNANALYDSISGTNDETKAVLALAEAISKASTAIDNYVSGSTPASRALADCFDSSGNPIVNPFDGTSSASLRVSSADSSEEWYMTTEEMEALLPPGYTLEDLELEDGDNGPYSKAGKAYAAGTVTQEDTTVDYGNYQGGFLYKPETEATGNLGIIMYAGPGPEYEVESVTLKSADGTVIESGDVYNSPWGFHTNASRLYLFDKTGSSYPDNMTVEVTLANGAKVEYNIPDSSQRWV